MRLLLGTNNPHKIDEISALLEGLNLEIVAPNEVGLAAEPREDGRSFAENALAKARFFSRAAGAPCLADDSGLEIAALDGRPGVLSSRYAPTDVERVRRVLEEMKDVPWERRGARFVCAAALVVPGPAPREIVELGTCDGVIAREPRGEGGFGYDPIFLLPDVGKTMAELSAREKNARSHRGCALQAMRAYLTGLALARCS